MDVNEFIDDDLKEFRYLLIEKFQPHLDKPGIKLLYDELLIEFNNRFGGFEIW